MGVTRTEKYTDTQNNLAKYLKVLGHPARIAIINEIVLQNACICGDLAVKLDLAQSTVSQHLKELKQVGIIKGTIEGPSVCYCIDEENWNQIKIAINTFMNAYDPEKNCC